MFREIIQQIRPALLILLSFTILTGAIYPCIVTGVAQLIFPWKANGSILERNGKSVGSFLIGQSFANPEYFYSRPSATSPFPYNGTASSGSNMGPSNPDFIAMVRARALNFQKMETGGHLIPVDLVTASGSGLDPDISPYAAYYQASRIAKLRKIPESEIRHLIDGLIQKRQLSVFGESRVNVLQLNLALDDLRTPNV